MNVWPKTTAEDCERRTCERSVPLRELPRKHKRRYSGTIEENGLDRGRRDTRYEGVGWNVVEFNMSKP